MRTDTYDPVKAHEYYIRTRELKSRHKKAPTSVSKGQNGSKVSNAPKARKAISSSEAQKAAARVGRLKSKVSKLKGALSEARAALAEKRQAAAKREKSRSDGKTTVKERQQAKEYREKHKQEIASKAKKKAASGGSSSKALSDMTVDELNARIDKINSALRNAQQQLSDASQKLGQLAHSAITSEPMINEHFAQFKSAERIPSQ